MLTKNKKIRISCGLYIQYPYSSVQNDTSGYSVSYIEKVKQSRYRPGVAQRVPGS
jgi:hypothetical protein